MIIQIEKNIYSLEAEKKVLACILLQPNYLFEAKKNITGEMFYFKAHKLIYDVILDLETNNKLININTVTDILQNRGLLEQIGGISVIVKIVQTAILKIKFSYYTQILKDKYIRRKLVFLATKIIQYSYSLNIELEVIFIEIEKTVQLLKPDANIKTTLPIKQILNEILIDLEQNVTPKGLKTNFYLLDELTNGFQNSDFIILAGRPGMGKSAFCLNLAQNLAFIHNKPILLFTLEMSKLQLIYRLLAFNTGINLNLLKTNKLTHNNWKTLKKVVQELSKLPLYIHDDPLISINEIRYILKQILFKEKKLGAVFIDYLQLIQGNFKSENRAQQVSFITRELKLIAREFNIPIIALSQLSRNVETRLNKRPILSDLRESGCFSLAQQNFGGPFKCWTGYQFVKMKPNLILFTGHKPIYLIKKSNLESCKLTSNHKLLVNTGWKRVDYLNQFELYFSKCNRKIIKSADIENIQYKCTSTTFDLSMNYFHNFTSKFLVLHNSIEQDADLVLMLYRDYYYTRDLKKENVAELILTKHRNGSLGTVQLGFDAKRAAFYNLI